jgi:hypothetical protein
MPVAEKNQSEVKNDRALQTLKDVFEAKKLTCLAYFKAYSGNEQIIIIPRSNDQIDCIIKIVKFIKIEIVDLNYLPITFGESLKQADIEIPMHVSKFVPAFHKSFEMAKAYVDQFEKGPLKKLNLKIDELTDEQLNELIKEVPNIARLTIHSGKITSLSLPNVKKLSLYGCRFLKNLKAPLAKSVEILECGLLNDAKSPLAEMVKVYNCDSLASLEAPLAKSVEIQECNLLNYAKFPLAEMVKVYNCDSLANLEAPLAEMVKVYNCDSLASLEAPLAKFVDIKLCPNLIYKNSKMELEEN